MNRVKGLCPYPSQEVNKKFKQLFGVSIKSCWDIYTGFDVLAFDDLVNPPDGVSCADHVGTVYGADALAFVRKLMGGNV